jgi:hypothetical protein
MQSSFHSPVPFLTFLLNHLRLPTLSVLSQVHILAGWHLETRLDSTRLDSIQLNSSLYPFRPDHAENTASLLVGRRVYSAVTYQLKLLDFCLRIRCSGDVFTESLPTNERLFWLRYSDFRASCQNINMVLKKQCVRLDSFVRGYGPVTGSYEQNKQSSGSIKRCWIYRLVKWLLVSHEELCPMELFLRSKYFYILLLNYGEIINVYPIFPYRNTLKIAVA